MFVGSLTSFHAKSQQSVLCSLQAGSFCTLLSLSPGVRVLKLRICDYPNPTRQRGIVFLRFGSVFKHPSLTLRVMINTSVFATMLYLIRKLRNFKTCTPDSEAIVNKFLAIIHTGDHS